MKKSHQTIIALAAAIMLALPFSCSKDNDDPRDTFVGTYTIWASYICSDNFGGFISNGYSGTIIVEKGSEKNKLLFTDTYQTRHPVTINGSNFTIETFNIIGGGIGSGTGSFGSNTISYYLGNRYPSTYLCTEEGSGSK